MRRSFILICVALLLSVFANAQSYQITVNITGDGNVTYNDAAVQNADVITVDEGATPAFTLTPETGYRVANVTLDGETNVTTDLVGNVYTFAAVTTDHILDVTFEAITYTITLTVGEHGTVTYNDEVVATSVTVNESSTPAFTFIPEDGYRVASLIVDIANEGGTDVIGQLDANNVYTFAAVTANHTLDVTFEEIPTYTITLNVGAHGTVYYNDEAVTTSVTINENATPAFTITPASCYRIASVLVDDVEVTATVIAANGVYTFENVIADHTIEATFEQITYTFTVNADANGSIAANDGNGNVANCGENKAFTIAANDCYRIASVLVDDVEVDLDLDLDENGVYTFENVTAAHTIAATFAINTYNITASAEGNGTITESCTANCGENKSFTIAANEGYRIASVIVDETENVTETVIAANGVYTFENVTANHTIVATFEAITYTITATAGEGGTITPTGAQTVNEGADQSFSIAASEGYRIASVIVDAATANENVTEAVIAADGVYTFENVTADHTIAATFEEIPTTYTITATADENGTITPSGEVTVEEGEEQSFTISASEGYRIASVIVDAATANENVTEAVIAANGIYTFENVTADHTIAATFEEIPTSYTITATADENGTITPSGEVTVEEGEEQSFTISASEGYRIASVIVDAATANENVTEAVIAADGVYTFENVTADHTIAATFEEIPTSYTITATAGENGTITPSGEVTVEEGDDKAFTIAANSCYRIASVIVDAETENEENVTDDVVNGVYTFVNVTTPHTISATFEVLSYTITTTAGNGGTITETGTVNCGSSKEITITANSGYRIASVIVDGNVNVTSQLSDGIYTFSNVTADHTIAATFELITYTITATASAGGTVTPASAVVNEGASHTVYIIANDGYRIERVMLDAETNITANVVNGVYNFENVTADHTIEATFAEIPVGPYFEFVNLEDTYQVGDSVRFSMLMHSNGSVDNLCQVDYKMTYSSNSSSSPLNLNDLSRYGLFSYDVWVVSDTVIHKPITRGNGTFSSDVEYHGSTYTVNAFTLGLFDNDCVDRNRPVDFDMLFTKTGHYQIKISLATCSNGGEPLGSSFVAENCDGMVHYDRYATTCDNKTVVREYVLDMDVQGTNVCTVTTSVPEGHGTISPEGTVVVAARSSLELTFTPDENYELDSLYVNDVMIYPPLTSTSETVVNNRYTLTNITTNQNVVAKFRDVRPYYNINVEVETAGGVVTPTDTTVVVGSDVTINIVPNSGYHISKLEIDGNIIIDYASSEIVFTNINSDHSIKISFFPNSVEENMFANLSVFPNPNNGQFTVSSDDFDGDVTFQIFSVSGAMMDERLVNGEKIVTFDKSLPAGTYFLRIIAGDKVATRKVVVE